jgi:hypothetical protein
MKHALKTITLFGCLLASGNAFAFHYDGARYSLDLGMGNKQIASSNESFEINSATGRSILVMAESDRHFAFGFEGSQVRYNLPESSDFAEGYDVSLHLRLLSGRFYIGPVALGVYGDLSVVAFSEHKVTSQARTGDESITLTGDSNNQARFINEFKNVGGRASIGMALELFDTGGLFAEYSRGREKWITERATYDDEVVDMKRVDANLQTTAVTVGLRLVN